MARSHSTAIAIDTDCILNITVPAFEIPKSLYQWFLTVRWPTRDSLGMSVSHILAIYNCLDLS
jgi:hypothetical protein